MSVQKKLLRGISILQSVKFSHVSDEVKIVATVKSVAEAIEVVKYVWYSGSFFTQYYNKLILWCR